jgi:hypothetical protein
LQMSLMATFGSSFFFLLALPYCIPILPPSFCPPSLHSPFVPLGLGAPHKIAFRVALNPVRLLELMPSAIRPHSSGLARIASRQGPPCRSPSPYRFPATDPLVQSLLLNIRWGRRDMHPDMPPSTLLPPGQPCQACSASLLAQAPASPLQEQSVSSCCSASEPKADFHCTVLPAKP